MVDGWASGGAGQQSLQVGSGAVEHRGDGRPSPSQGLHEARLLLGDVGDDSLGRVRGRGGAQVGDQVENRAVAFMADGRDDGSDGVRDGTHQPLIGEGKEVLHAAASASQHDHVDAGSRFELGQGLEHGVDGPRALNLHLPYIEAHSGPAGSRIDDHVLLGLRVAPADEPDRPRKERKPLLALRGEQALRRQPSPQLLQPCKDVPDSHGADLVGPQGQGAVGLVEIRLGADDDPRARLDSQGKQVRRDLHRHRRLGLQIAKGEELNPRAWAALQGDDFSLDPQTRHGGHVFADLHRQDPQRPRPLRTRLCRELGQLRRHRDFLRHAYMLPHALSRVMCPFT